MSEILHIHSESPQPRLISRAVEAVRDGGVVVYPTDTSYALGCRIGEKAALDRIRAIRQLDERHNFTLACRDLSDIAIYAKVDNQNYRLLKAFTPGPYTFILPATRQVPRMLQHPKRKTIGIRLPQHAITMALLEELGEPLMTTSLILPDEEYPLRDPEEIQERLGRQVDLIIDGGSSGSLEPSTVVDLAEGAPRVLRSGAGDPSPFEAG
jgi:tRNA threonylcarbamoyl adenosine modification protein (Sua5/YciO/YrdC/YwlC family)